MEEPPLDSKQQSSRKRRLLAGVVVAGLAFGASSCGLLRTAGTAAEHQAPEAGQAAKSLAKKILNGGKEGAEDARPKKPGEVELPRPNKPVKTIEKDKTKTKVEVTAEASYYSITYSQVPGAWNDGELAENEIISFSCFAAEGELKLKVRKRIEVDDPEIKASSSSVSRDSLGAWLAESVAFTPRPVDDNGSPCTYVVEKLQDA